MKQLISILLITTVTFSIYGQPNKTTTEELLAKAKAEKKSTFIIMNNGESASDSLLNHIKECTANRDDISIFKMDKNGKENKEFIAQYRLNNAPTPLILVFTDKGVLLGGITKEEATKEQIIKAIPSPKYSELSYAMEKGKAMFILISNDSFENHTSASELCKNAQKEDPKSIELIFIDCKDEKENNLLKMLKVSKELENSYIITFDKQGYISARFSTLPSKEKLIEAATEEPESSCSSGNCGHNH